MGKVTSINKHFQYFLDEMKETFWGDLHGQTRQAWQRFLPVSQRQLRAKFCELRWDDSLTHSADAGEELLALRVAPLSAAGGTSFAADPRSLFCGVSRPDKWGGWGPP
jgi:hypothetical protein